jgi:hypothetical protein
VKAGATFLWGLKRSGNHLVANWLYANLGASAKGELDTSGLHPQLCQGFADEAVSVAFFNNCGRLYSRAFHLGSLEPSDFRTAMERHRATIFGLEDCQLACASRTPAGPDVANVLILRDPLNNLASRLEGAKTRPEIFRTDREYVDLFDSFCSEFLGHTNHLASKTVVSYNRFVQDRAYRDELAAELGFENQDVVAEATDFGGGSSFSALTESNPASSLMTRFRQHPLPPRFKRMLLERDAIRQACSTVFGYDVAELVVEA